MLAATTKTGKTIAPGHSQSGIISIMSNLFCNG